jgi:voltage-gated potassium channel
VSRAVRNLTNNLLLLFLIYAGAILSGALIFSFAESKPLFDSLWWAVITATSVGYGDIFPVTVIGRITGMLLANVVLLAIVPLLTGRYSAQMIVDSDAFTHAEQEEIKKLLVEINERLKKLDV